MRYRNISSGIVPIVGKYSVTPGREIELTAEDLEDSQIAVYVNPNYLVPVTEETLLPLEVTSARKEMPDNMQASDFTGEGVSVVAKVSSEEELKEASDKIEAQMTVAIPTAATDKESGAAIQTIVEVTREKIDGLLAEFKALSWKKRAEFVLTITDLPLLQAVILEELADKTKEAVEARIKELQSK